MRWKRIFIIGLAAAALALSLYAVSLAQAGIRTIQTNENDRAAIGGIIHFQTTRSALLNAASIASLMLTTKALITDIPVKDGAGAMASGGGPPTY